MLRAKSPTRSLRHEGEDLNRIYLDYAATTALDPAVREAMQPWLDCGNPSSLHEEGRAAKHAIDGAREILAARLGCAFGEVIFTSSGTEAANLAVVGAALANADLSRRRLVFGAAEHHCVLATQPVLERLGYRVDLAPVDPFGRIDLDRLQDLLAPDVLLVSVMHANNELGTLQPVDEVARLAHGVGALYHCDAVQTLGTSHLDRRVVDGADLITFSAHKLHGPKGAGALYVKAGTKLQPLTVGGGQERELRAGTENVVAIVGFGAAVALPRPRGPEIRACRDRFLDQLIEFGFVPTVPDRNLIVSGHAHVRMPGLKAETMLIRLDRMGISASSGAACSSGSLEPSHVLLACGYSREEASEGLRFTFGAGIDEKIADEAATRVIAAAQAIAGHAML